MAKGWHSGEKKVAPKDSLIDGGFRNYHQLYDYISKEVCANWVENLCVAG